MRFDIITIFPNLFNSFLQESLLAKALKKGLIKISVHNLRQWTTDKHHKVDDRPYGGGPGMILKVEPIARALRALKCGMKNAKCRIIMLDPAGKQFNQRMAERFSKLDRVIFLCGRYEGFDHRITKFCDERISVGPYVLNGGEVPAMVVIEAIARLVPGFVGKAESLKEETFGSVKKLNKLNKLNRLKCQPIQPLNLSTSEQYVEYPQYTRPEAFAIHDPRSTIKKLAVPKVLLSGDHKKIKEWQAKHSK